MCEVIRKCRPGDYEGDENAAGYRLKEEIEAAINYRSDGSGIEWEVRDRQP
jgi:hypothetical protein